MARELNERIIGFYRGWYQLAAKTSVEQAYWVLVDDLCQKTVPVPSFATTQDVSVELDKLISAAAATSGPYAAYTKAKLAQSKLYLSQATSKKLTRADIAARGIPWFVPELEALEALREQTMALKNDAQAALSARGEDPVAYFTEAMSSRAAASFLKQDGDFWLREAQRLWGIATDDVVYDTESRDLNASFQNLVITEGGRILLILNNTFASAFTKAHLRFLALHEILGHVLHFTKLRADRKINEEAPHLSCISIHTADALHVEGIAQIISEAMIKAKPNQFPEVACQVSWGNLFMAVRHRNICRLIDGEVSVSDAAKEHVRLMDAPQSRIPALEEMYAERLTDPFACIQGLAYYASLKRYQAWLEMDVNTFAGNIDKLFFDFAKMG